MDVNNTGLALGLLQLALEILNLSFKLREIFCYLSVFLLHVLHVVPERRSLVSEVVKQVLLRVFRKFVLRSERNQIYTD